MTRKGYKQSPATREKLSARLSDPELQSRRIAKIRAANEREKGPRHIPDENGCWIWQWGTNGQGYANHGHRRRLYEEACGPYPTGRGWTLHHLCANTLCVRPDHAMPIPRTAHNELHRRLTRGWKKLTVAERIELSNRLTEEMKITA